MGYTNSPENSTYKTVELQFTATKWPRSSDASIGRDPDIFNMYFDRNSNENQTRDFVLVKRAGLELTSIDLSKTSGQQINGVFQDTNTGYIYWSNNNKVMRYNGTTVTTLGTMGGTVPDGPGSVGFCLFLKSTGVRYLMINNGSELWYHDVTTSAMTKVTDADYPGTTSVNMVFLDGYLFVVKTNTGDIYNSDLDDPTSWTAGNYATAEINPDFSITLAKVKNYLVCFGTDGIEFFYDGANPQGSPLARNESYYKQVSLYSSVCNIGDVLYFVGKEHNGDAKVYKLDGNNLSIVSSPWVSRYLSQTAEGINAGSTIISFRYLVNFYCNGHRFLGINTGSNYIIVYDVDEGFWYTWSFANSTTGNIICGAVRGGIGFIDRQSLLFIQDQSYIVSLKDDIYQDYGVNFTASYTSEDYTAETFNWKSCHRIGLLCDYPTTSAASYAQVSWSDDDGNTWSSPRNLTVTTNNPYITQCGRFRTRNWRITYSDNYPFRMWGLSMDLNVGNI